MREGSFALGVHVSEGRTEEDRGGQRGRGGEEEEEEEEEGEEEDRQQINLGLQVSLCKLYVKSKVIMKVVYINVPSFPPW